MTRDLYAVTEEKVSATLAVAQPTARAFSVLEDQAIRGLDGVGLRRAGDAAPRGSASAVEANGVLAVGVRRSTGGPARRATHSWAT